MSENLIEIRRKVVDELYAMHGKEGIDGLLGMIKEEVFNYIQNVGEPYYLEMYQKTRKKILNRKEKKRNSGGIK
jgi:hypothetical protein